MYNRYVFHPEKNKLHDSNRQGEMAKYDKPLGQICSLLPCFIWWKQWNAEAVACPFTTQEINKNVKTSLIDNCCQKIIVILQELLGEWAYYQ